jgi:1-acyl-sn-glycerol-3-phosphate acyltransferase
VLPDYYCHSAVGIPSVSRNCPIDRGDARKTAKSLKLLIDGLRAGKSLMVFPEGTRTPDGRLQEFKHGAFKIAARAGVLVVPVAIRGTFKLLPKTTLQDARSAIAAKLV